MASSKVWLNTTTAVTGYTEHWRKLDEIKKLMALMNIKLNDQKLLQAIEKCLSNAERLIEDARLLKANDRKERSYTLFQLGLEETGKALQIFQFLIFENIEDEIARRNFLKEFKDHKVKTRSAIGMDYLVLLVAKEVIQDKLQFLEASLYEYQNIDKINDTKNFSLYTSIVNDNFLTPEDLIHEQDLTNIEFRCLTRFGAAKSFLGIVTKNLFELREFAKTQQYNLHDPKFIKTLWERLL